MLADKISDFFKKLQGLSDGKKKLILWIIVGILAIIMGSFWIKGTIKSISEISGKAKNIQFPAIDISMPDINLPDMGDIMENTSPSDSKIIK